MTKKSWVTQADIDDMKAMFQNKASYQVIADKYTELKGFKVTRGSIAGILARNGAACGDKNKAGRPRTRVKKVVVKPAPVMIVEEPIVVPKSYPHAALFDDMDFESRCNWPLQSNPIMYCGVPKDRDRRKPYCRYHASINRR